MANANAVIPAIGMGATGYSGTDRRPFTVSRITSPRSVWLRADNYKVVSGSAQDGSAVYEITPDENSPEFEVTLRKNGGWYPKGVSMGYGGYSVGTRDAYMDPHF